MSKEANERYGYHEDRLTALEAITEAQKIAFAPMLFQAALNLRDSGILAILMLPAKKDLALTKSILRLN